MSTQTVNLSQELYQQLEQIAYRQQRSLNEVLSDALEVYLSLGEDMPLEAIKASFLEGWHQAMTNQPTRSVWDVIREIDDES